MPGTVLGTEDAAMNMKKQHFLPHGAYIQVEFYIQLLSPTLPSIDSLE